MAIFCAILVLVCMVFPHAVHGDDGQAAERAELIAALMHSDMFYGSDDYFGDHRELAYADRVVPTSSAKKEEPGETKAEVKAPADNASDENPSDDAPSDDETPVDPPAVEPPSDDGTGDDIGDDISDDIGDDIGDDISDPGG